MHFRIAQPLPVAGVGAADEIVRAAVEGLRALDRATEVSDRIIALPLIVDARTTTGQVGDSRLIDVALAAQRAQPLCDVGHFPHHAVMIGSGQGRDESLSYRLALPATDR